MNSRKRYRNPSPPRTSGPVPFEEVTLHGQRKWPKGTKSVDLIPVGPPPTEVTLYPQEKLIEAVAARRKAVLEALAQLADDGPNFGGEQLERFVRTWRYELGDPQTWAHIGEFLVSHPVVCSDREFHLLFTAISWRLATYWLGAAGVLRESAAKWLTEHGLTLWDQLDEPAKKRVADLLHERLRLVEAEQRGRRDVLNALESFGRASRQLP